jgi:hypothetical protein
MRRIRARHAIFHLGHRAERIRNHRSAGCRLYHIESKQLGPVAGKTSEPPHFLGTRIAPDRRSFLRTKVKSGPQTNFLSLRLPDALIRPREFVSDKCRGG